MKSQAISDSLIADAMREFGFNSKRDRATLMGRCTYEGEQFLSITLPRLSDLLLEGLESSVLPTFVGWNKKRGTMLPEFLYDLWKLVFAPDGSLLSEPSVRAIYWIRQISVTHKKVFAVCADEYIEPAIDKFIDNDLSLPRKVWASDSLSSVAHWLFGRAVGRATVDWESIFRNGPGAVADRYNVNERWDFPTISRSIEAAFGADRFRPDWASLRDDYPKAVDVPARLVAVPKTATKPRLISIEPAHNQYLQQSMMTVLYKELSSLWAVNIFDQIPNQDLARRGSVDKFLSTIDLSDASDRISLELVQACFGWNKSFLNFLEATRSYEVEIPGRGTFFLRKFASMGSALTFPVETMVFCTIVILAMCIQDGDVSRRNALEHFNSRNVRVYGDDIIMPTQYYQSVTKLLSLYGSSVNMNKSFHQGSFRESCGKDWFSGYDVTPRYVRQSFDDGHLDANAIASMVSLHNQLFETNGETLTTDMIRREVVRRGYDLPTFSIFKPDVIQTWVEQEQAAKLVHVVRHQEVGGLYFLGYETTGEFRFNENLQSLETKTYYLRSIKPLAPSSDRAKLLKTLVGPKSEDTSHLTKGGHSPFATLKRGWRAIF